MGGQGDTIQLGTGIDLSGFKAGSEKLKGAVKSLANGVKTTMKTIAGVGKSVIGAFKTVFTSITNGFKAVSKTVSSFVGSTSRALRTIGSTVNKVLSPLRKGVGKLASIFNPFGKGANQMLGSVKQLIPMLIGVGSAYQVISKSVSAFMQQNQELTAKMNSVWTALGNVLGPIITQIINWVTTAVSYFLEFLRLLGVTNKTAAQLSRRANQAGSALKKQLAGFDELNILSDNNGGGNNDANLEDKEAPEWIQDIADFLKRGEWALAGAALAQKLNDIVNGVDWKNIGALVGEKFNNVLEFLYAAVTTFDWKNLGKKLADAINSTITKIDWLKLGALIVSKFTIPLKFLYGFLTGLEARTIAQKFSDFIIGGLNELISTIESFDATALADQLVAFIEGIKWSDIQDRFVELFVDVINFALTFITSARSGINWSGAGKRLGTLINGIWTKIPWKTVGAELSDLFKSAVEGITSTLNTVDWTKIGSDIKDFLVNWIKWDEIKDAMLGLMSGVLKAGVDFLWGLLGFEGDTSGLYTFIDGLIEKINKWATAIAEFVKNAWNGENGLKKIFSFGGGNGEQTPFEKTLSAISKLLESLDSFASTLKEPLKQLWDEVLSKMVGSVFNVAIPGFLGLLSGSLDSLSGVISNHGSSLISSLGSLWGVVESMLDATLRSAQDIVPGLITQVGEGLSGLPNSLYNIVNNLSKLWTEFILPAATKLTDDGTLGGFLNAVSGFFSSVSGVVETAMPYLLQFLNDFVTPFLRLAFTALTDNLQSLARDIENISKIAKGEASVNDLLWEHGTWFNGTIEDRLSDVPFEKLTYSIHGASNALRDFQTVYDPSGFTPEINTEATDEFTASVLGLKDSLLSYGEGVQESNVATQFLDSSLGGLAAKYVELVKSGLGAEEMSETMTQMDQELADIVLQYVGILEQEGYYLDKNGHIVKQTADAVGEMAQETEEGAAAVQAMSEGVEGQEGSLGKTEKAATDYGDTTGKVGKEVVKNSEEMTDGTEATYEDLQKSAEETNENVTAEFTELGEGIEASMKENMEGMRSDFQEGTTDLGRITAEQTRDAVDVFDYNMGIMSDHAYRYGVDMMQQYALGMSRGFIAYIGPMMVDVTRGIWSYIHFSEPDKGPLSDFHTYGPDMMKLLASGIKDYAPVALDAVSDVADAISSEMEGGDYNLGIGTSFGIDDALNGFSDKIVYSFSALMDKLDAIAERVTFRLPAVAGGTFLPYSVGLGDKYLPSAPGGDDRRPENEEVMDILRSILDAVREGKIIAVDRYELGQVVRRSLESDMRSRGKSIL